MRKKRQSGWFSIPAILLSLTFSFVFVFIYRDILDTKVLFNNNVTTNSLRISEEFRSTLLLSASKSVCPQFCSLTRVQWRKGSPLQSSVQSQSRFEKSDFSKFDPLKLESGTLKDIWFSSSYIDRESGEPLFRVCLTKDKRAIHCVWGTRTIRFGSALLTLN